MLFISIFTTEMPHGFLNFSSGWNLPTSTTITKTITAILELLRSCLIIFVEQKRNCTVAMDEFCVLHYLMTKCLRKRWLAHCVCLLYKIYNYKLKLEVLCAVRNGLETKRERAIASHKILEFAVARSKIYAFSRLAKPFFWLARSCCFAQEVAPFQLSAPTFNSYPTLFVLFEWR